MSWPIVGGDYRSWGPKILAILQSTHEEDGGLKDAIVDTVAEDASIRAADLVTGGLATHVGRVDNPHGTTASQVGALTKTGADTLYADKAATEAAISRVDPGDSPADSLVIRSASGTPISVTTPHVYAVARGFVPATNTPEAAATNAAVLQAIWDANKVAILPRGIHYYDTTLIPKNYSGLVGSGNGYCHLVYTGDGHGLSAMDSDGITGVYSAVMIGVTITNSGDATGDGFRTDCWRQSYMERMSFVGFAGSGMHLYGDFGDFKGTWSNRWIDCVFNGNGRHGIEAVGDQHNFDLFYGCATAINGLDGIYAENPQKWHWGFQSEQNGRHGVSIWGGKDEDLSPMYFEHHDPFVTQPGNMHPSATQSTTRYIIRLGRHPSLLNHCRSIKVGPAHMEGGDNGTTSKVDAGVYAEYVNRLTIDGPYIANVRNNRSLDIQTTVAEVNIVSINYHGLLDSSSTDRLNRIAGMYRPTQLGPRAIPYRGLMGVTEGTENLLVNGGFDVYSTTPGLPEGWTNFSGSGAYTRETGSDGGYRAVITNVGSAFSGIYQVISGAQAGQLVKAGKGVLVVDIIIPTTNTDDSAQIRVQCKDSGGTLVGGGGYAMGATGLPESDTETTCVMPFGVHPNTVTVEVLVLASTKSQVNTDVIKVDRMAVYAGEVPKAYTPRPLPAPVAPAANPDTSGATLTDLEIEVNELKSALRTAGIIGS